MTRSIDETSLLMCQEYIVFDESAKCVAMWISA